MSRTRVLTLLKESLDFLRTLEEGKVFPSVLAVEQIVEDKFGRQYVECRDDRGRTEHIYTNQDIDPARHYFMHPLTNPARIYPVLVAYRPAR